MSLIFAGSEPEAFKQLNPGALSFTTTVGTGDGNYDSNFARGALVPGASSAYYVVLNSGLTEIWIRWRSRDTGDVGQSSADWFYVKNQAGTEVFWFEGEGVGSSERFTAERWDGSVRQTVGSFLTHAQQSAIFYDVHIKIDASAGIIRVYQDNMLQAEYTGDTSALGTTIDEIYFANSASHQPYISECIIADESTIGWRVETHYGVGTGANTAWTGDYDDTDDADLNDASSISTTSNSVDESFILNDMGATAETMEIKGVVVSARAKNDAAGPGNIDMLLRPVSTNYVNGTNYLDTQTALTAGYLPYQAVWETNPEDSGAWANTDIDALQAGVRSLA